MRIDPKLALKLKLKLTPRLLLEAELLQLPVLELSDRIRRELENNPCLEEEKNWEDKQEEKEDVTIPKIEDIRGDATLPLSIDTDEDEREDSWEAPQLSFWERIDIQLGVHFERNKKKRKIAQTIVENLDGKGFLSKSVEVLSKELGIPEEEIESVREEIMYNFDPVGIASMGLQELYLVQLKDANLEASLIYKIIRDRWQDIQSVGIESVVKDSHLTKDQEEMAFRALKRLYPDPVSKYEGGLSEYIYPEVVIKTVEDKMIVEVMDRWVQRLTLSSYYIKMLEDETTSSDVKRFVREKIKGALEFLKAVENRRNNIIKVVEFIANTHRDFILGENSILRPITQSEAAERLGISLSTFNRIVKGRYVDTPIGVFELRFFFTKGVRRGARRVSVDYLIRRIEEIIRNEPKDKPLSDKEISTILKGEGFHIARRTVAEYRKGLGIPTAKERKKL